MKKLFNRIRQYVGGIADALRLARDIEKITQPDYDGWGYGEGA